MDIEYLIGKFYKGDSTQVEERFLMEYFLNEENVDEHLKEDQQVFRLLHKTQIQVPVGVSERLENALFLYKNDVIFRKNHIINKLYYWIGSAAAVVLLCIGLYVATSEHKPPKMADTFSDPTEAALVAEQTLAFMSVQLNKGLSKVAAAEYELEKVNQLLIKHLNK